MAFPITATEHPRGWYEIDGVRYPRVSRIIGLIAKPGIGTWRERLIREGRDPDAETKEAAGYGTALHKILEDIDREPTQYDSARISIATPFEHRETVAAYMRWRVANVARVLMVEQTVYHENHRFAGTLDRLYLLKNGARVIGDFKSGKSVDGTYRLQQMAYQEALESMGQGPVDGRLILHMPRIRPGELKIIEYDDEERDRRAWRACLRLWRWYERHKNDWRATPGNGSR